MSTGCSPITSLSASKCSGSAVSSQRRCSSQRIINRLRNTNPEKFDTMCKMHLSFILDLSGGSLEELLCEPRLQNGNNTEVNSTMGPLSDRSNGSLGETTGKPKRHHIFSRKRTSKGDKVTDIQTSPINTRLSQEAIDLIHPILEFVGRPENICQEGLFRKTGLLARQRQLRERLHTGGNISDIVAEFSSESYSSHDGANLIKTLLGELSEPLLTEKHYNVHGQVANMVRPDMTPDHQTLMQGRQLQALQLLFLLLPRENMQLLECLLSLLHRVVQEPANKMTADTLGTMFAPHIILPRKMSACEIQQSASDSTRAVSFMIKHAPSLFQAPMSLIRDIDNYWAEVEETIVHSSTPNSYNTMAEPCHIKAKRALAVPPPDVVNTTVSFVDRAASQSAAAQTDTQTALAELYAHVSAMPKSAKQKKMIKQFNKANGPGTPMMTPQSSKPKSRTLGESIKRIVSRNHRRRPSGHSTNVNTVSPSIETNSTNATTPGSAVSSDRNRAAEASTPSPFDNIDNCDTPTADKPPELPRVPPPHPVTPELVSPVKRLFTDEENCSTPTPASPHVTIVDMKVPCGDRTNTIHNSAQSKNAKSKCPMMTRKRKLQLMDIAVNKNNVQSTPIAGRLFSSETMRDDRLSHVYLGTCCRDAHVVDTRDRENLMLSSPVLSPKCHAPLVVTPDRRLDKPTAFISPITRTIQSASEVIQIQAMTPGSRRPMAVLQSP